MALVGESKLPFGHVPLLLHGGELTLQTASGSVQLMLLDTHAFMQRLAGSQPSASTAPDQVEA